MPFAGYKDFADCVAKNSDKENPQAYCGTIQKKAEAKNMKLNYDSIIEKFDLEENPTTKAKSLMVHGIAIKEVTSRNGVKYIAKELQKAVPSLKGKPILKDHKNDTDNVIGKVLDSSWNETDKSIPFKGLIMDEKVQNLILNGLINHVSIGASVKNMKQEEADNGDKIMVAEGIEILELSITPVPGVPQASISAGESLAFAFESMVEQMMKCPECGKMMKDKEELDTHMTSSHKKEKEATEVNTMEQPSPELARAKEALIDVVLTLDNSWQKEVLNTFNLEGLQALIARTKTSMMTESKKSTPKGMVSTTEETPKTDSILRVPLNADETLRTVPKNTMVIEQGKNNKINFWKMPDYTKYRKY